MAGFSILKEGYIKKNVQIHPLLSSLIFKEFRLNKEHLYFHYMTWYHGIIWVTNAKSNYVYKQWRPNISFEYL